MASSTAPTIDISAGFYVPGTGAGLPKGTRQRILGQSATGALGSAPTALYTCPAGVKAIVGYLNWLAQFSSAGASQQLTIGRSPSARATAPTVADVLYTSAVGANTGALLADTITMAPGDVLWAFDANRASGATGGYVVTGAATEIADPNSNIVPLSGTLPSSGAVQSVYTVPAGRKAHLLANIPDAWVAGTVYNPGTASESLYVFITPAAAGPSGTPVAGTRLVVAQPQIAAAGAAGFPLVSMTLFAGDVLGLSVAGATAINYNLALLLE